MILAAAATATDPAIGLLAVPSIGAVLGVAVSAVSAVIAWWGVRLSARRPQLMVAAVLGGTLARLVLVAAASTALLLLTSVHVGGYVTGLLVSYLVFLAAEIYWLSRGGGTR